MNARERFHATFEYGQPDRVFLMPQWTFNDTRQRWLREGMPWDVHFNTYFGFDRMETIPINMGIFPPLQTKVIEQTAHWRITEDEFGGLTKRWSDRELGMSQWIRSSVRDRETWEKWKQRLDPDAPNRYPEYWNTKTYPQGKLILRGFRGFRGRCSLVLRKLFHLRSLADTRNLRVGKDGMPVERTSLG